MKKYIVLVFSVCLLLSNICFAETKEIIAEGTYVMGDSDTPANAENGALINAKRVAIEQAGTSIESYSQIKNMQLTKDDIETISSGALKTTILDKKKLATLDGTMFLWVKIKCIVDTDSLEILQNKIKELKITSNKSDTFNPTWKYLCEIYIYTAHNTVYIDSSSVKVIGTQNPIIKCWIKHDWEKSSVVTLKNININTLDEQVLEKRSYTNNKLTQIKKYDDAIWETPIQRSGQTENSDIIYWARTNHML
jgi:hypothetical protein